MGMGMGPMGMGGRGRGSAVQRRRGGAERGQGTEGEDGYGYGLGYPSGSGYDTAQYCTVLEYGKARQAGYHKSTRARRGPGSAARWRREGWILYPVWRDSRG